jgi:hypothetical protein
MPRRLDRGETPLHRLRWTELAEIAASPHANPVRRKRAEHYLVAELPGLSLGERVALARRAVGGVIASLAQSEEVQVLVALLGNARLVEPVAAAIAGNPRTPPLVLSHLAASERWNRRRSILMALAGNETTPAHVALGVARLLAPDDLALLGRSPGAPRIVRIAARRWSRRRHPPKAPGTGAGGVPPCSSSGPR